MGIYTLLLATIALCCRATLGSLTVVQTLDFQTNNSFSNPDVKEYFTSLLYWSADDTYMVTTDARYQVHYNTIQVTDGSGPYCLDKSRSGEPYTECFWLGAQWYNRTEALEDCMRNAGTLALIEDHGTMMWLAGKFPQLKGASPYWIGGYIDSKDHNVIWAGDNRGSLPWTAWAPAEPSNGTHKVLEIRELQYYSQPKSKESLFVCFNTTEIYCGQAPQFPFAEIIQRTALYMKTGGYATYGCKNANDNIGGRPGIDNITLTCDVDPSDVTKAQLSPSSFTCEEPNCGYPPDFIGAEIADNSLLLEKVQVLGFIRYKCKDGYTQPEAAGGSGAGPVTTAPHAICEQDGTWTNNTSVCEARYHCVEPPPLEGATLMYDTLALYGMAIYTCRQTQVFKHSRTQQLNSTCILTAPGGSSLMAAEWEDLNDKCEDIQCVAPLPIAGATISSATSGPVGSTRNYHCDEGHRFQSGDTTWTVTCSDKGEWTPAPSAQCEEINCGTPPLVWQSIYPSDDIMGRDVKLGQSVFYQCQSDYVFTNDITAKVNKTLTCDLGGWNERHPGTCEKISCGKPEISQDHKLSFTASTIGAKAVYTCAFDGYAFEGGKETWESECKLKAASPSEATWTDVPYNCNPVDCVPEGPPPPLGSSMESLTSHRMGAHVTYRCDGSGYFLYGGRVRTVTCNGDGAWGSIPEGLGCQDQQCSAHPTVADADIISTGGQMVGSVTSYKCKPGTRYITGLTHFSLKCLPSGSWTTPRNGCQVSQCPPIPLVGNADVSSPRQGAAQSVTVVCHRGHRFPDGSSKKTFGCSASRGWSLQDTEHRCYRQTCSPIHLPNGNMNDTSIFYDTVTEINCDAGFRFEDGGSKRSLLCDAPGVWHGNYSLCTAVTCSNTPVVPDATVMSGGRGVTWYNQTVVYTCTQGMRFEDGLTQTSVRCVAQDTWDKTLSCAARCSAPPVVKDADITTFSVDPGNVTTYQCRRGYRLSANQSEANITCDVTTLSWTDTTPVCNTTHCAAVDGLAQTSMNTTQTVFDTAVSLWCEHGYSFTHLTPSTSLVSSQTTSGLTSGLTSELTSGINSLSSGVTSRPTSMTSVCGADGDWDPLIKSCQSSVCTELPDVPYSIMHGVYGTYGDVITVTCLPGYWVQRDVMYVNITCGADGNWHGAPEECKPITCPPLGTWEYYQTNTSSTSPGTVANVTCVDESSASTAVGWQVSLCGELGVWLDPNSGIPDLINCTEDYSEVVIEPVDAPASTPIGVVWVLLALVPVVFILLGDILPLYSQIKH